MEQFRYDSYCGLYCGACDIMAIFQRSVKENWVPTWEDLPTKMCENLTFIKKQDIKCYGCKTDNVFGGCAKCLIRKCAREKKKVMVCLECDKYPCLRFRIFSLVRGFMKKKLPHLTSVASNQEYIGEYGMINWLIEQENQWSCPQCGAGFTWYMKKCHSCGCELESTKGF